MCVAACLGGRVFTTKTRDRSDLKLGTVVDIAIVPQPTDLGFRDTIYGLWLGAGLWFRVGVRNGVRVMV